MNLKHVLRVLYTYTTSSTLELHQQNGHGTLFVDWYTHTIYCPAVVVSSPIYYNHVHSVHFPRFTSIIRSDRFQSFLSLEGDRMGIELKLHDSIDPSSAKLYV